jgi:Spy/CpxP family protein refolding chaperone
MKRRVFLSVMVVALLGSFSIANAQEEKKGKDRGGRGAVMAAALEKAKLTDEQKAKIKTINEESEAAAKAAREAKDREAGRKVFTERQEKIMAVLTDEQKEIVKKYLAENAPRREKDKKKPE